MASQVEKLHFILVPLMSQSHLIPFMDMAKLIARRGATVSMSVTPVNAAKNQSFIDHAKNSGLKIQFIHIKFPSKEVGLPEGVETLDNNSASPEMMMKLFAAHNFFEEPLVKWIEESDLPPSCIISDLGCPWTSNLAVRFNVPRFVFHTVSCFCLLASHCSGKYRVRETEGSDSDRFVMPGLPDKIEYTKAQLPKTTTMLGSSRRGGNGGESKERLEGMLVNSFEELEPEYVKTFEKEKEEEKEKIYCIGPLSLCNQAMEDKVGRGGQDGVDEHYCMNWLDTQKPNSVLYVCFGSLCQFSTEQLKEMGLGLAASNRPFMWVLKKADCTPELEEWLVEDKFEEKIAGRGLIIRGWAPQVLILSHQTIGGFMTHCGWNSTLEAIASGVPMITWPIFADQFHNEKLIVYVLKTGVSVGVKKSIQLGGKEQPEVIKHDEVKKAIEELMDEGEEGNERRKRAKEYGEKANKAVAEGGSSYRNLTAIIQHVLNHVGNR